MYLLNEFKSVVRQMGLFAFLQSAIRFSYKIRREIYLRVEFNTFLVWIESPCNIDHIIFSFKCTLCIVYITR